MNPSPTIMTARKEEFRSLNGLRFLAAMAVVAFHYAPKIDAYSRVPAPLRKLILEGPAAVGFFFILSGFLLAHRYLHEASPANTKAAFYWSRFCRLYPAYIAGFVLFAPIALQKYVLHPSSAKPAPQTFFASAVLYCLTLQSWTPLAQAWNGPSWSLSVEAFMYLLFPFIGRRLTRLGPRNTCVVLFVAWLIPPGLACAHAAHLIEASLWRDYLGNNPLLWLPLFVMGICSSNLLPAWRKVRPRRAGLIATGCLASVTVLGAIWPGSWLEIFVMGGISPLLVALVVSFTRTSGSVARFLGGSLCNQLGRISYIIYIVQSPLWHYWQGLTDVLRGGSSHLAVAAWQFFIFLPVLIFIAFGLEHAVELPARRWLSRRNGTRWLALWPARRTTATGERPLAS